MSMQKDGIDPPGSSIDGVSALRSCGSSRSAAGGIAGGMWDSTLWNGSIRFCWFGRTGATAETARSVPSAFSFRRRGPSFGTIVRFLRYPVGTVVPAAPATTRSAGADSFSQLRQTVASRNTRSGRSRCAVPSQARSIIASNSARCRSMCFSMRPPGCRKSGGRVPGRSPVGGRWTPRPAYPATAPDY